MPDRLARGSVSKSVSGQDSDKAMVKGGPRVALVILNWNGVSDTIECLSSVLACGYLPLDVIVVDNGSVGNDVEVLGERFGSAIHLVINDRNLGFAEGNNVGIEYAMERVNPDYVLLLNNDTVVDRDFVTELVRAAETLPEPGVLASKMYYYDEPEILWYAGGLFQWFGFNLHIGKGKRDRGQYETIEVTQYAPFASVLITRTALEKVGLLSTDYFLQWEDLDYCVRSARAGLRCYYVPKSRVWHKVSMSSKEGDLVYLKLFHGIRGRILIRRKFLAPVLSLVYIFIFWLFIVPAHSAYYLVMRRDPRLIGAMLRGAFAGIRDNPKKRNAHTVIPEKASTRRP